MKLLPVYKHIISPTEDRNTHLFQEGKEDSFIMEHYEKESQAVFSSKLFSLKYNNECLLEQVSSLTRNMALE